MSDVRYPEELPSAIAEAKPFELWEAIQKAFADGSLPPLINQQVVTPESRALIDKLVERMQSQRPAWSRTQCISWLLRQQDVEH